MYEVSIVPAYVDAWMYLLYPHMLTLGTQGVACDTLGNLLQDEANAEQFLRLDGVDAVFAVVRPKR